MQGFATYIKESDSSLTPQDVYDFYYITLLMRRALSDTGEANVKARLYELRETYLSAFRPLVITQLEKYHRQGRLDTDSDGDYIFGADELPNADYRFLHWAMKQTYRSDMTRRNEVWNDLTEHLAGLEKSRTPRQIVYNIDRVNNAVHNTGQLILTKMSHGQELKRAFDFSHNARDGEDFRPHVSRELLRIR